MKNINKITISTLSVVALCLVGGLFYLMNNTKGEPPITSNDTKPPIVEDVKVPEIPKPIIIDPSDKIDDTTIIDDTEKDNIIIDEKEPIKQDDEQKKSSDDKPKTPSEATPPTDNTPPKVDENGDDIPKVVEPNKPADNTPKDGDTREDGAIYIEGFGWIEDSGEENTTTIGDFEITGEIVGEMGN